MQVQLIQEASYTVKVGMKCHVGMRVVSEWEGLKKLQDAQGRVLIVMESAGAYARLFKQFAGDKEHVADVIMGTPELINELQVSQNNNNSQTSAN